MKKLVKLITIVGCLVGTNLSASTASNWSGLKEVTSVQVLQHGGMIIYFDSEVNPACTNAGTKSIYIIRGYQGVTIEGEQAFLSSAYVALTSGLRANVLFDASTPHCFGKYFIVSK